MTEDEFSKAVKTRLRAAIAPHMEMVRPFLLEALRQPEGRRGRLMDAVVSHHTGYLGNVLVSFNMTICGNADAAESNIIAQLDHLKNALGSIMDGIRSGVHMPVVTAVNIDTGQPVPFDFRDHLSKGGAS